MSSVCTAISEFGWDLFKEISKDGAQKNIFLSPFSISAALAMVSYGARGNTEAQMEKVLHFRESQHTGTSGSGDSSATGSQKPCNVNEPTAADSQCDRPGGIHSQFQALLLQLNKPSNKYELSIANRLYGSMDFPFEQHLRKVRTSQTQYYMRSNICVHNLQKYLRCTKELYHAGLESVDFEKAQTSENINSWVSSQTQGKIKDLFPEGSLDPPIAMVIVNAIYFKGLWSSRFKKENTKEAPFRVNKNMSKNVPMMFQNGDFKYAAIQEPALQLLELPYANKEIHMIILLPNNGDFSNQFATFLTYKNIEEWTSSMYCQKVNVYLPKFKLEEKYNLKATLQSMGMTLPFERSKAGLSGISEKQGLFVSRVTHKSFVEVNEEGTEAAAATGVTAVPMSAQIPVDFKANVPFFFIIFHNLFKCPLFIGRYATP
ncbi:serpin B11-like [Hemicordylus capensis]|uniref:serpin B11-like n=1 Tax=Hemicordylus capensis TaxID=884348 RepID=UPI0023041637|nr:serpin B11-like [Hemicordylus capensis]